MAASIFLHKKGMAVGFSRRGFLKGVLASVSITALTRGCLKRRSDGLADAFRCELCAPVDVEAALSEPADVGRAYVAALKDSLSGRGMPQEALLVRRMPHMATVV